MKKIILINIIILLTVIGVLEFISYNKIKESFGPINPMRDFGYTIPHVYNYENKKDTFEAIIPENTKGAIVLFGCSYADIAGLKSQEEMFARQLSKKTGRIVYKRSRANTSTGFMYKQLNDKNFKLEVPDMEYIIYVFIRHHSFRNCRFSSTMFSSPDLRYKIDKNGNLKEIRPFLTMPLYMLFTVMHLQDKIAGARSLREQETQEPLLVKLVTESNNLANQKYANFKKFIFLEYPDGVYSLPEDQQYDDLNKRNLSKEVIKQLENFGITYVNAEELVGHELRDLKKYRCDDLEHPNKEAWDEVSTALIKRFNL